MALDSRRGPWSASGRPASRGKGDGSGRGPSEEDARFLAQLEEMDPGRLMLELKATRDEASQLRDRLQGAQDEARLARERADELQGQSARALDDASLQISQLKERLRLASEDAQRAKKQHEEELLMVMMSAKEKDEVRFARESELQKELSSLRDQVGNVSKDSFLLESPGALPMLNREESQEKIQSLTQELEAAHAQLEELHEQLEEDEDELDALEEELSKSRKRVEELSAEAGSLSAQLETLRAEVENEKELARVAEQVAEDEVSRRVEAERECEEAIRELERLRAEGYGDRDKEGEKEEEEEEVAQLKAELADALERCQEQEEEFKEMLDAAKEDFAARERDCQQLLQAKEEELQEVQRQLSAMEEKETVAQAMCESLREENRALKAEAGAAQTRLTKVEGEYEQLRRAGQGGLRGMVPGAAAESASGARALGEGAQDKTSKEAHKNEEENEYASGSEFSFSLPVPIKGAWRAARELAAEYYDAGAGNEDDELAAREAEVEELQEENDSLEAQVESLTEQVLKSKRLVANYEKMRRRIMQLRVCLELTRKVVEVKDRAMEMAIERARAAEGRARDLEATQGHLEEQLALAEDELHKALEDLERAQQQQQQSHGSQGSRGRPGGDRGSGGASTPPDSVSGRNGMGPMGHKPLDARKKFGLTVSVPGNSDEEGEKDMVEALRDGELQPDPRARQRNRRPKPVAFSRTSSGTSRASEVVGLTRVMSSVKSGPLDSAQPIGMKDLQHTRDGLKRVMRELREKAAVLAETQLAIGSKSSRAQTDILRPVEEEVGEAQALVDKVEKVLSKMSALELKGASLKKKLDSKKQQILDLESKLGMNINRRKVPTSCFR